jgi:hypothetical protein
MKLDFRRRTEKFRHGIVRLIAPKVYVDYLNRVNIDSVITATPRPMILFLKECFKYSGMLTGVEIGVAKANNALSILQELPIKKLILIDPYMAYVDSGRLTITTEEVFNIAKLRLSSYKQVQFIRKTSEEAAKDIDELLDFVYIDGNHSYEYVKQDIANYYPLVKQGGIVGGHDYNPYRTIGVYQAVNEFVQQRSRIGFYAVFPDWWIVK